MSKSPSRQLIGSTQLFKITSFITLFCFSVNQILLAAPIQASASSRIIPVQQNQGLPGYEESQRASSESSSANESVSSLDFLGEQNSLQLLLPEKDLQQEEIVKPLSMKSLSEETTQAPPVIIFTSTIPTKTNKRSGEVTYTVDGVKKTRVYNLVEEGLNGLIFQESNNFGTTFKRLWIELDTKGPEIVITSVIPAKTNQDILKVTYTLDGVVRSTKFKLKEEGINHLSITKADELGNITKKTFSVELDTKGPEIVITSVIPAKTNQDILKVTYTLDGVVRSTKFKLKEEGINHLSITKADELGNITKKTFSVELDTKGPEIVITSVIPAKTNQDILKVTYTLDGIVRSTKFNLTEGVNHHAITKTDEVGNVTTKSFSVELDTKGPVIVVTDKVPAQTTQATLLLHYTADGIAKTKNFDLNPGINNLSFTESDALGNPSAYNFSIERISEDSQPVIPGVSFNLTSSKGDIFNYMDGKLQSIKTLQNGSWVTLQNLNLNTAGDFVSGNVKLPGDSSVRILTSGEIEVVGTDGSSAVFKDGLLNRLIQTDGVVFRFQANAALNQEIKVQFYRLEDLQGNPIVRTDLQTPFQFVIYDATTKALKKIKNAQGQTLELNTAGEIVKVFDADGKEIALIDSLDHAAAGFSGMQITQGGAKAIYDESGILREIAYQDVHIFYKMSGQNLVMDLVKKDDGTVINQPVYQGGVLQSGTIRYPSGDIVVYASGKPQTLQSGNLYYTYHYLSDQITVDLDPASLSVANDNAVIKKHLNQNFVLQSVVFKNGDMLSYRPDGNISEFKSADTNAQPVTYHYTENPTKLSYVEQGANQIFYDEQGNIEKEMIAAQGNNPALEVHYLNGKIDKVYKTGLPDPIFVYHYFQENGTDIVQIDEITKNSETNQNQTVRKKFQDGNLQSSLDLASNVLTTYMYDSATQKIKEARATRLGRELHRYAYQYEGDKTIVTDEEGVKRTYGRSDVSIINTVSSDVCTQFEGTQECSTTMTNQIVDASSIDNALLSLEENGSRWNYSYHKNQNGEMIVERKLGSKALKEGAVLYYGENGKLESIVNQNEGYVVSNIVLDSVKATLKTATVTFDSGMKEFYSTEADNSVLIERVTSDGHHYFFKDSKLIRVQFGSEVYLFSSPDQNGNSGPVLGLKINTDQDVHLAKNVYGDGSDGDATIESSMVLTRNMYYQNLTIRPGAVLNPNGYKIFVAGKLINAGVIDSSGKNGQNNSDLANDASVGASGGNGLNSTELRGSGMGGRGGADWFQRSLGSTTGQPGESLSLSFGGNGGNGGVGSNGGAQGGSGGSNSLSGADFYSISQIAGGNGGGGGGVVKIFHILRGIVIIGQPFSGGGGGSGGGNIFISAKNIDNTTGMISARGGDGGNGAHETQGSGGGGGGGGGVISLISDVLNQGNLSVAGGQGGAGGSGATNGQGGSSGRIFSSSPSGLNSFGDLPLQDDSVLDPNLVRLESRQWYNDLIEGFSSDIVVDEEYSQAGFLESQTRANQTTLIFDNQNRPEQLLNPQGSLSIQYQYENAGKLSRVYLKEGREQVQDEIQHIRDELAIKKQEALIDLAYLNGAIDLQLKQSFDQGRAQFEGALSQFNQALSDLEGTKVSGGKAKRKKSEALDDLRNQIAKVTINYQAFNQSQMESNVQLKQKFSELEAQIHSQYEINLTEVNQRELELQHQVVLQEVSPLIYDQFRNDLGRDPSDGEYQFYADQIDYASGAAGAALKNKNGEEFNTFLRNHLQTNYASELAERQAYVANVKRVVTEKVNQYLALSASAKVSYAAALGLTYNSSNPSQSDVKELTASDAAKILTWLNSRSLHFGQSAFLSLEKLLDQDGIVYTREELAVRAIMIDILSGVITPIDDGELVLSVFALTKTAGTYGVNLQGGKNINWDDLKGIFQRNPNEKVIAHVNGNHFIVITAVNGDQITYTDMGIGKDKENQSVTVSKAEFLKSFQGNIVIKNSALQQVSNAPAKTMSRDEAQKVRGAFFGFILIAIIHAITAVAAAVIAVVAAVAFVVAQVIALVATIVTTIATTIGNILVTIGKAVFAGIKFAASTLYNFGHSLFATSSSQATFGGAAKTTFGHQLFHHAVTTVVSISASKGLEALGVDPQIAALASALVTGGVAGGLNNGFTLAHVATGATQGLILQGTQTVLVQAGVDPALAGILALGTTALVGGAISGTLKDTFVTLKPEITKQLASYGVSKTGEAFGIDSKFAPVFNAVVSGTITGSLSADKLSPKVFFDSAMKGLKEGAVSVAIDYLEEEGGLDPLLATVSARALSGAIAGALDPNQNIFQGITDSLKTSVLNVAVPGTPGQDAYSQAVYLQHVLQYSEMIKSEGLAKAISNRATQILKADAINSIVQSFGTVQNWIEDALRHPEKFKSKTVDGKTRKVLTIDANNELEFSENLDDLSLIKRGNEILEGRFGVDGNGKWGLLEGSIVKDLNTGTIKTSLQNGKAQEIKISPKGSNAAAGEIKILRLPKNDELKFDAEGNIWAGEIIGSDFKMTMRDGFADIYEKNMTGIAYDPAHPERLIVPPSFSWARQSDETIQFKLTPNDETPVVKPAPNPTPDDLEKLKNTLPHNQDKNLASKAWEYAHRLAAAMGTTVDIKLQYSESLTKNDLFTTMTETTMTNGTVIDLNPNRDAKLTLNFDLSDVPQGGHIKASLGISESAQTPTGDNKGGIFASLSFPILAEKIGVMKTEFGYSFESQKANISNTYEVVYKDDNVADETYRITAQVENAFTEVETDIHNKPATEAALTAAAIYTLVASLEKEALKRTAGVAADALKKKLLDSMGEVAFP